MLLFSIVSLPCLYLLITNKNSYKELVIFFNGCIISSIVSIITWAFSTFLLFDSDSLINITIKFIFIIIVPLIFLFGFYTYAHLSKRIFKNIPKSFVCGFLYWNLLFSLLLDIRVTSSFNLLIMPLYYMLLFYVFSKLDNVEFKKNNKIYKIIYIILIPFIILIINTLTLLSVFISIFVFIIILVFMLMIKLNILNIKNKLFIT